MLEVSYIQREPLFKFEDPMPILLFCHTDISTAPSSTAHADEKILERYITKDDILCILAQFDTKWTKRNKILEGDSQSGESMCPRHIQFGLANARVASASPDNRSFGAPLSF